MGSVILLLEGGSAFTGESSCLVKSCVAVQTRFFGERKGLWYNIFLEESFPSKIVLFVDELVLVETPYFRVERPATPIFEHKFVAEAH